MEPQTAKYQVARKGQVIGVFSLHGLVEQLDTRQLNLEDHYWTEGMGDWQPLSNLTPLLDRARTELAALRKQEKEAAEAKRLAEKEAAKAKAKAEEEARLLKAKQEAELAAAKEAQFREEQARLNAPQPWKCLTCGHGFSRSGKIQEFPEASGFGSAIGLLIVAGILAAAGVALPGIGILLMLIAGIIALASLGMLIAYGVERGLQQFHSYHPRCPECSSPHCAKVARGDTSG